tara:strand:- start:2065 stop:2604 length:540 start_codon:yes stop_codon:yes gene_type:complete
MPLYDYTCTDGHKFEELVQRDNANVISCIAEDCTCIANRSTVYAVTTIGPVFEHMEAYNNSLLSKKQRKAGMELRSAKDIRMMEEELGMHRVDPGSPEGKQLLEKQMDDHRDITKVKEKDGKTAAVDHVYKTEITRDTGWTDGQYCNWKSGNDKATATAKSGGVDLSTAKRRTDSKPSP